MSKRDDYRQRLESVFREVFDDDAIELSDATTAADVDGWDSVTHVTLIARCEEAFAIAKRLSPAEIGRTKSLKNVGELLDFLIERGKV